MADDAGPPSLHSTAQTNASSEVVHIPKVADDVETNKDLAAFSYLYVMSVIVYFLKGKESAFIRYHGKQAMILFLLAIIAWFIPILGPVLELVILAGVAVGFLHAAQGQWKDVWVVGPLSRGEMNVRDAWREVVRFFASVASGLRQGMQKEQNAGPANTDSATDAPMSPADADVLGKTGNAPQGQEALPMDASEPDKPG